MRGIILVIVSAVSIALIVAKYRLAMRTDISQLCIIPSRIRIPRLHLRVTATAYYALRVFGKWNALCIITTREASSEKSRNNYLVLRQIYVEVI